MKNKNILIVVVVTVVMAAGIIAFWLLRPGIAIEQVLPQGPVAYVRMAHGEDLWGSFLKSPFYQGLATIDVVKVLKHNKVDAKVIEDYESLLHQWVQLNNNPWVKRVLGKEVAIAFYPDKTKGVYPLIVVRLDPTMQTAQVVTQIFQPTNQDVEITSQQLKGKTVYALTMKKYKQVFYYVRYQDVLVIAQDDPGFLSGVLERVDNKGVPLSQDVNWRFSKDNAYAQSGIEAFLSPVGLLRAINPRRSVAKDSAWDDFKVMAVSFNHAELSRFKFSVDVNKHKDSCPPADNKSLALVPANAIIYNWGNCYDLKGYWQALQEGLADYPAFVQWRNYYTKAIKRRLGIDFEKEVLPLVGRELGGYLTDIDTKALFPYPRLLIFVKLTDPLKMRALIDQIQDKLPVDLSQENYAGTSINYLNLSLGSNTDPSYGVIGDYLLLATSRQLLKKTIDTYAVPARSLAGDKLAKDLGLGNIADANAAIFLRTASMIKRVRLLSDWAEKFLASQVSTADAYSKEWESRKVDFDVMIDEKNEEFKSAQERLLEIQDQDPQLIESQRGIITTDMERLKEDIADLNDQKQQGFSQVKAYEAQASSARLAMFNSANVLMPVLNALETIEAQSIKFHVTANVMHTELVIK